MAQKRPDRPKKKNNYTVFIDFDNTITTRDVFDDVIMNFSIDDRWEKLEKDWKDGKISSRECLSGQLEGVRIEKKRLDRHLATIRLDPYFKRLMRLFNSRRIRTVILSDNFDYILGRVLNGKVDSNLRIYSNRIRFEDDKLIPSFPFENRSCRTCGHCKKETLLANAGRGSTTVYIGDGLSDLCPAEYTDVVFAKGSLPEYLKQRKVPHNVCDSLKEVYEYFKGNT